MGDAHGASLAQAQAVGHAADEGEMDWTGKECPTNFRFIAREGFEKLFHKGKEDEFVEENDLKELKKRWGSNDDAKEFLACLHADGDGKVSIDKFCKVWKGFGPMDSNTDGIITKEELKGVMKGWRPGDKTYPTDPEVQDFFEGLGAKKGDSRITFAEFCSSSSISSGAACPEDFKEEFLSFSGDTTKTVITKEELKKLMTQWDRDPNAPDKDVVVDDERVRNLLKQLGAKGDDKVTVDEFCEAKKQETEDQKKAEEQAHQDRMQIAAGAAGKFAAGAGNSGRGQSGKKKKNLMDKFNKMRQREAP